VSRFAKFKLDDFPTPAFIKLTAMWAFLFLKRRIVFIPPSTLFE